MCCVKEPPHKFWKQPKSLRVTGISQVRLQTTRHTAVLEKLPHAQGEQHSPFSDYTQTKSKLISFWTSCGRLPWSQSETLRTHVQ